MKSLSNIVIVIIVLLFSLNSFAQIKNAKTETIKISGNCEMCKSSIEKAGNIKKQANIVWNSDTKMAVIVYDTSKTSTDEILKRIALAGYDNDYFLAPADVYAKLPGCCQYERTLKPSPQNEHFNHNHSKTVADIPSTPQNTSPLQTLFNDYFELKDALIKTDADAASTKTTALQKAIKAVDMNTLSTEEHRVWMKVMKDLVLDAEHILNSNNIEHQRDRFMNLSNKIYELIKVSKHETPVYYQHCPMFNDGKGANWLSKEEAIKNPYYGSKMLTCGSTVETIK